MRDILLKKTAGSSTLPALINLVQYNNNTNEVDFETASGTFGSTAYGAFPFAIDVPTKMISSASAFYKINELFKELRYPTISKTFLENNFIIYTIPDYGHQALSPFYQDFMVMIFNTEGKKVSQKDIGYIRAYHNKEMYILVNKNNNLGLKGEKDEEVTIRVIFKSAVDKAKGNEDIKLEYNSELKNFKHSIDKGPFPFTGKDISAFNIFFKDKNGVEHRLLNVFNSKFFSISFSNDDNKDIIIRPQADYFRKTYGTDFREAGNIEEVKEDRINIEVNSVNFGFNDGDFNNTSIILKSVQSNEEYFLNNYTNDKHIFEDKRNINDFIFFDSKGNHTIDIPHSYEAVPIFNRSRLAILAGNTNNDANIDLNQWLKRNKNISYNLKLDERDYLYFKNKITEDKYQHIAYVFFNSEIKETIQDIDESPEIEDIKLDDIKYDSDFTVVNDPYLSRFNNDIQDEGALIVLENISDEIKVDKDITIDENDIINNAPVTDNSLIINRIGNVYSSIYNKYGVIYNNFLFNFLVNTIEGNVLDFENDFKEEPLSDSGIFILKSKTQDSSKEDGNIFFKTVKTPRGHEIVKFISKNGYSYGILDTKSDTDGYEYYLLFQEE